MLLAQFNILFFFSARFVVCCLISGSGRQTNELYAAGMLAGSVAFGCTLDRCNVATCDGRTNKKGLFSFYVDRYLKLHVPAIPLYSHKINTCIGSAGQPVQWPTVSSSSSTHPSQAGFLFNLSVVSSCTLKIDCVVVG